MHVQRADNGAMDRLFFALGSLSAGLAVALGAFGAHALAWRHHAAGRCGVDRGMGLPGLGRLARHGRRMKVPTRRGGAS